MILTNSIKFTLDQEQRYDALPIDRKQMFVRKYKKKKKSIFITYLLWFLLGFHYSYLGRWDKLLAYLVTCGGLGFWMLWDMFTIPKKVREHNENMIDELLYECTPF